MSRREPTYGNHPTVEVRGGPVEVLDLPATDAGEGLAPLVLLHEGLGSIALWRSFPHDLHAATGRRTVVFSRHGHGGSAPAELPRPVTYMHHEAQVVLPQLLATLGIGDGAVLVGHSDGASIALLHAGSGAGRPAALVLLAPHVVVEDVSIAGIEEAEVAWRTTPLPERLGRHHADAEATFRGWNDVWLSPAFRDWDVREQLSGVACPSLLVQGHDDQYGTMRQLDLVQAGVAGPTTRVELDDCGHSPHLDRPDAAREAVVSFLAGLDVSGAAGPRVGT